MALSLEKSPKQRAGALSQPRLLPDVSPTSSGNLFRRRRLELLREMIEQVVAAQGSCHLLDIGGTRGFWGVWGDLFDWSKISITCVNHDPTHYAEGETRIEMVQGDARNLSAFSDRAFDIVFSNSVIEHVGQWDDMKAMAREVRRLAPSYLVQTPDFWFPIEPHSRALFLHWAPEPIGYRMVMTRAGGKWGRQKSVDAAMHHLHSARLLDVRQMRTLFPDATIRRERFLGLPKSILAIRQA